MCAVLAAAPFAPQPYPFFPPAGTLWQDLVIAKQQIGVPIFAALDGQVTDAHDGEPDPKFPPV